MKFLIVEPSPLPILIPLGPKYSPIHSRCNNNYLGINNLNYNEIKNVAKINENTSFQDFNALTDYVLCLGDLPILI